MIYKTVVLEDQIKSTVDVHEISKVTNKYMISFFILKSKAEMHLCKVCIEARATIPLHFHLSPLIGHRQKGQLR